ncbi:MAG: hypothetical protein H0T73_05570 [Ardenticatenales bacterium]|nr:hypothetical protein [Ardenticatenales bacterium]
MILSTHIVEDIATTCHALAVMHGGQIRFKRSPAALLHAAEGHSWELTLTPEQHLGGGLPDSEGK